MSIAALLRLFSSSLVVLTAATAQGPGTIKILGPGGGSFATIQDAVVAAAPGAVILVLGGTHVENVVIDKPLTLRGAGGPAISVGTGSAIFVDKPAGPVVIEGFALESASTTQPTVLYDGLNADPGNGGTIRRCDIQGGFMGMVIRDCNATVEQNRFSDNLLRGLQVNSGVSSHVEAEVSNNTFVGQFVVAGALQPTSANAMSAFNCTAQVAGNTFENFAFGFSFFVCDGHATGNVVTNVAIGINIVGSPGFAVLGNTCTHEPAFRDLLKAALRVSGHVRLSGSTDVTVQGNTLSGATINLAVVDDSKNATITDNVIRDAVKVGGTNGTGISFNFGSAEGAHLHGNNIEDNETFAVHDFGGTSFPIDATGNWWGSATGPSAVVPNAIVSPNVVFTPFLTAPNPGAGA